MTDRELEKMIRKAAHRAAPDRLKAILSLCTPERQNVRSSPSALPLSFSRIIFDVNPSVSLEVDDEENITAVTPLNADAEEILSGLSLEGEPLGEAVDALVESMVEKGYLSDMANTILISVQNADERKQAQLQDEVSRLAADVMIENLGGTEAEASVISQSVSMDPELSELAGEYGISEGKAALIQKMLKSQNTGPDGSSKAGSFTFADLAPMSINDIALLAKEENMNDNTVNSMGSPSERGCIGHRQALQTALSYAGVTMADVYKHKVKFDCKRGMLLYKVSLGTRRGKFKYFLDARTGSMVRCGRHGGKKGKHGYKHYYKYNKYMGGRNYCMGKNYNYNYSAYENIPMPEGVIGEEQAKQAALNHAGVTEAQCQYVYCHPEVDHGRVEHYDVKFVANGQKYKYAIGLYDGAVLGRGVKDKGMKTGYMYEGNYHEHMAPPMGPSAGTPVPPQPAQQAQAPACHDGVCDIPAPGPAPAPGQMPQTPPPVMQNMQTLGGSMISEDEALNIALNHAGLTFNDIFRWRVKLLTKHGRMVYRTKLKVMGYEYEIDVDAYSGAITRAHKEVDF